MPFTPFHLGPGAAFKAFGGRYFSFMVFGFSQVAMDIEVLVRILRGDSLLHGFTHTHFGATLIGIVSVLIGKPVCEYFLRWWKETLSLQRIRLQISWLAAVIGGMIGVYSHVLLDSIMHAHMRPLAPFSDGNPLLDVISNGNLYLGCLGLGGFGIVSLLVVCVFRKVLPLKQKGEL